MHWCLLVCQVLLKVMWLVQSVDIYCSRSDVLGQFMPLVGKDWTQSGVAKLFSAIKVLLRYCLLPHVKEAYCLNYCDEADLVIHFLDASIL